MQEAVHRLAAINDGTPDSEDGPEDSHGDSLKEVVVLSTAHSWNPQKLVGRAAAADGWTEAGESRPLLSQQSSPQQPLRSQASQQLANHSPMKAAASRTKPTVQRSFLTVLACLLWVAASSGAILVNKKIMVDLHFPYPGTVGAIGMVGTSIIAAAVRLLGIVPATQKVSIKFLTTQVMPTGLFLALAMQLGNTAYLHLSVAFVQMLKAFTPVCTMLFAFLFQLEQPSASLISAVVMIAVGVTTASYAEGNLSWAGLAAMVGSMLCEGLRLVMMQSMIAKRSFHPLEALLYLAPAASFWMLLFAAFTEVIHIHQDQHLTNLTDHPMYIAASAAAGFGVNAMAMAVISLASALTLKILGICKDVGLVLYGVALLGEHVTRLQFSGYSISIIGLIWYNSIKMFGPAATASNGSSRRASMSVRPDDLNSQGNGSHKSAGSVRQSAFAKVGNSKAELK